MSCGNLGSGRDIDVLSKSYRGGTMSRVQLALNVENLDRVDRLLLEAVRHAAGEGQAGLRELRRRLAAVEADPDGEPGPRRFDQPPRRRGPRRRARSTRSRPASPPPASRRSSSAARPAATRSRTSSGSRVRRTASSGRSTRCSRTRTPTRVRRGRDLLRPGRVSPALLLRLEALPSRFGLGTRQGLGGKVRGPVASHRRVRSGRPAGVVKGRSDGGAGGPVTSPRRGAVTGGGNRSTTPPSRTPNGSSR